MNFSPEKPNPAPEKISNEKTEKELNNLKEKTFIDKIPEKEKEYFSKIRSIIEKNNQLPFKNPKIKSSISLALSRTLAEEFISHQIKFKENFDPNKGFKDNIVIEMDKVSFLLTLQRKVQSLKNFFLNLVNQNGGENQLIKKYPAITNPFKMYETLKLYLHGKLGTNQILSNLKEKKEINQESNESKEKKLKEIFSKGKEVLEQSKKTIDKNPQAKKELQSLFGAELGKSVNLLTFLEWIYNFAQKIGLGSMLNKFIKGIFGYDAKKIIEEGKKRAFPEFYNTLNFILSPFKNHIQVENLAKNHPLKEFLEEKNVSYVDKIQTYGDLTTSSLRFVKHLQFKNGKISFVKNPDPLLRNQAINVLFNPKSILEIAKQYGVSTTILEHYIDIKQENGKTTLIINLELLDKFLQQIMNKNNIDYVTPQNLLLAVKEWEQLNKDANKFSSTYYPSNQKTISSNPINKNIITKDKTKTIEKIGNIDIYNKIFSETAKKLFNIPISKNAYEKYIQAIAQAESSNNYHQVTLIKNNKGKTIGYALGKHQFTLYKDKTKDQKDGTLIHYCKQAGCRCQNSQLCVKKYLSSKPIQEKMMFLLSMDNLKILYNYQKQGKIKVTSDKQLISLLAKIHLGGPKAIFKNYKDSTTGISTNRYAQKIVNKFEKTA